MHPAQILVVDDDRAARNALVEVLRMEGYCVEDAESGLAALRTLEEFTPDLVLSDLNMPQMDGDRFVELARQLGRPFRAIILSGAVGADKLAAAVGADFLPKPIEMVELLMWIDRGLPPRVFA